MNPLELDRSALLVMDLQKDIVAMLGPRGDSLVQTTAGVIAAARLAGVPVVYVVLGFRPGYPEVSPRNAAFSALAGSGRFQAGVPGADVVPAVAPHENDVVVVKHRVGAFTGTDLEIVLRARGVNTLVLTGISTSGVVLSTVRHGADADYKLVVVKDCCADADDEVHRVLTEKVFVRQATVTTAVALTAALAVV